MSDLNSKADKRPRFCRWLFRLSLPFLIAVAALLIERGRGQWELSSWKKDMAGKGEVFDVKQTPVSAATIEFSNRFAALNGGWREAKRLWPYLGQQSSMIADKSGGYRRGSQESQPPLPHLEATNTWEDLNQALQQNASTIESLRELLKHPPSEISYDLQAASDHDSFPNYVANRQIAQRLQIDAMNELHQGNVAPAEQDLEAIFSLTKLNEDDPTLLAYMLRIAVLGLSTDVSWDALQSDGWTEPQLATLQHECLDTGRMLSQMPKTLETERAIRIQTLHWFSSHLYQSWLDRYEEILEGAGMKPSVKDTAWQRKFFHPVWSFAWADQEELGYLRHAQRDITIFRDAARQRSSLPLKQQLTAHQQSYRAPAAAWRFYRKLPVVDTLFELNSAGKPVRPLEDDEGYPYADFTRAWQVTAKNLTLHEMVITAIAIKRHELKNGKPPQDLNALVPDYLSALPTDFMDGQPLRYKLEADGAFALYSIGEDMHDDGGNPEPTTAGGSGSRWNGRDWVWPRLASARPEK